MLCNVGSRMWVNFGARHRFWRAGNLNLACGVPRSGVPGLQTAVDIQVFIYFCSSFQEAYPDIDRPCEGKFCGSPKPGLYNRVS